MPIGEEANLSASSLAPHNSSQSSICLLACHLPVSKLGLIIQDKWISKESFWVWWEAKSKRTMSRRQNNKFQVNHDSTMLARLWQLQVHHFKNISHTTAVTGMTWNYISSMDSHVNLSCQTKVTNQEPWVLPRCVYSIPLKCTQAMSYLNLDWKVLIAFHSIAEEI